MSIQKLNAELFVELSDGQEECVSGGGQLRDLDEYFNTDFEAAQTVNLTRIASGPGGSFVEEKFATANVDTDAYKSIDASFD
jgi:hypothetical protein